MTKEEIIAAVKECAEKMGHAPTVEELNKFSKITRTQVQRHFVTHTKMLAASGVMREGAGYPIDLRALFLDWAEVARSLKKIPTLTEYGIHSKYSIRPLSGRYKTWGNVPAGMLTYARQEGLEEEWRDVVEMIVMRLNVESGLAATCKQPIEPVRPKLLPGQPTYGPPLLNSVLTYAPTNEAGVVLLFGSVARELGFSVLRVQTEFPDCEAMRLVEEDRWQRVRIEFEYESRNFLTHMHLISGCDLIVCWSDNWPDCPLEVLELRRIAKIAGIAKIGN